MKKLFVLFLLVALVPFSVGCSLWGGDDDAVTYPPILTAKVVVPAAGLSLRGASVAGTDYSAYTITLNGVTLPATSYEVVSGSSNVEITFSSIVSQADKDSVEKATLPVTVVITGNGKTVYAVVESAAKTLTLTVVGGVVTKVEDSAGTAVDFGTSDKGFFDIATVKFGETTIGSTKAGAATVNSLTPTFVITFDNYTVVAADLAEEYDITAKNANSTVAAQDLSADMFTLSVVEGNLSVAVKQSETKKLVDGQTYQVNVNYLKNSEDKIVTPAVFYFTVGL